MDPVRSGISKVQFVYAEYWDSFQAHHIALLHSLVVTFLSLSLTAIRPISGSREAMDIAELTGAIMKEAELSGE